jgi:hypothetical protein
MDSRITVRFYTVVPSEIGQPNFESCLKKLMSLGPNPARPVNDTAIQASNLSTDGNRISGDLVRIQNENLPSLLRPRGSARKNWTSQPGRA